MKKKIALISLLIILLTLVVTGTLAYFQAKDEVKNTVTIGEIKIQQHEQERDENGQLQDFTQGQYLYPVVNVNNPSLDAHYVEKLVTVENKGRNDAYVRTFVAVPKALKDVVCLDVNNGDWIKDDIAWSNVTIEHTEYVVVSYTYAKVLETKKTTEPVLHGVYMDHRVDLQTNPETNIKQFCIGDTFFNFDVNQPIDVYVMSQACQTRGLGDDPQSALNSAFQNTLPSFE